MKVLAVQWPGEADADEIAAPPMRPLRGTIMPTIVIWMLGLGLIAGLWLMAFSMIRADQGLRVRQAQVEAKNLASAFQLQLTCTMTTVARTMDMVADRMRSDPGFDIREWAQGPFILFNPPLAGATLLGPDGKVTSATLMQEPRQRDLNDREYVRVPLAKRLAGLFIGKPMTGRITHKVEIPVSRVVLSDDGRLLGMIVLLLAPDQLTTLYPSIDLGRSGRIELIGTDNVVRARAGPGVAGGSSGLGIEDPLPAADLPADASEVRSFIDVSPFDHVTRLVAVRRLAGLPLVVMAELDLSDALSRSRVYREQVLSSAALVTGLLACVALLLTDGTRRRAEREAAQGSERMLLAAEATRRRQTVARLRESEVRLRDFANVASEWFWEQDAELRFVAVSPGVPPIPQEQVSCLNERRCDEHATRQEPGWPERRKTDLPLHRPFSDVRCDWTDADGKPHIIALKGVPVFDQDGRFAGYRGTGCDITAKLTAETELQAARERAARAEALLQDAVESINEGLLIFDRDDRLVLCNQVCRDQCPECAGLMVPGVAFEELMRCHLAHGIYREAVGREEEWLADRLQHHREDVDPVELALSDGRWILVTEHRLPNGGLVELRTDITELKRAQAALRETAERLDRAQEIAGVGSWELDIPSGRYFWSRELYRIRGFSPDSFQPDIHNVTAYIHADDKLKFRRWIESLREGSRDDSIEARIARPGGGERLLRIEGRAIVDADGVVRRLNGTMQDITERRLFEQQVVQAQKMEAIGNLTGGVAHDFNNLLAVIMGNLQLLSETMPERGEPAELLADALSAARRGADLTRRLLAFARRQPLLPEATDINALITEIARLLGRMLGEDMEIELRLTDDLRPTVVDPVQLEAAIANLATNARDAMPHGGRLTIETRIVTIDAAEAARSSAARPGDYLLIAVTDTGLGMPPDVVARAFEPFFTTKPKGRGTGLGLSMVFGFIKQSGGHVSIASEVGKGSVLRLYLPYRREAGAFPPAAPRREVTGGTETLLVVEDNPEARRIAVRQLRELGYHVIEAHSVPAAQAVLDGGEVIDLLLADVVMPGPVDGLALAAEACRRHGDLKVLLMSGFPDARGEAVAETRLAYRLISKPFGRQELAGAVRDVLDTPVPVDRMSLTGAGD